MLGFLFGSVYFKSLSLPPPFLLPSLSFSLSLSPTDDNAALEDDNCQTEARRRRNRRAALRSPRARRLGSAAGESEGAGSLAAVERGGWVCTAGCGAEESRLCPCCSESVGRLRSESEEERYKPGGALFFLPPDSTVSLSSLLCLWSPWF